MKYLILAATCWWIIISLVSVFLTVYDKRIAGSGKRRIPESTLMTVGLLGGAAVMYFTMKKNPPQDKAQKIYARSSGGSDFTYCCYSSCDLFVALLIFAVFVRHFRLNGGHCFSYIDSVIVLLESYGNFYCAIAFRAIILTAEILV